MQCVAPKAMPLLFEEELMYCSKCGKETGEEAGFCPHCGAPAKAAQAQTQLTRRHTGPDVSEKLILPAFLLCWFLGFLGAHRFYVGKTGTGVVWLLTLGILGFGALYDFIMIIIGSFTDSEGKTLKNWTD
jgi:TM2 domain-containing membrane protein YozV